ncbi:hypothetical protein [Bacteroides reticulotermitis]|uniref:DUF4374 domain-containing protein n=2 Tax=Bacteroides reticulotermitis TaxID=1133319 RepID=W4USP3_9BACE|nr:hypothetical protein [Bacteroides reticulotermitis]MBB4043493.1 hypothetical protein [Bacteroides reticulotermitis]GAE83534.1 hypothetical protein JCM10512_1816 [Bacteroides reticulotermitis JCM 10512]
MNKTFIAILGCLTIGFSFFACSDSPENNGGEIKIPNEYALWITATDGSYILTTNDLMKDTVLSPANNQGVDITGYLPAAFYGVYAYSYGGKYYLSNDGTRFSQFEITDNGQFKEKNNMAFGHSFYIGKVLEYLSTDNEMVFTHTSGKEDRTKNVLKKPIYFMDTNSMTITKELTAEIPFLDYPVYLENGDIDPTTMNVSSMEVRGDKAFFGYYFYNSKWKALSDSMYIYVCDYPGMGNGKVLKDSRGGSIDAHWSIERRSFFDDNKNLYYITAKPNGGKSLIRIKNNETEIDQQYLFDLSDYNFGDGNIVELGNGKTYIAPYVIDAANKKIVADLRILAGGAEPKTTMNFVENGKLYDVFKTDESRWFVYEYDPTTNTMKRGLEIDGGVSWVYHVNKLK